MEIVNSQNKESLNQQNQFTDWDKEKFGDKVRVFMKDYAKSMKDIMEIRKGDNKVQLKEMI